MNQLAFRVFTDAVIMIVFIRCVPEFHIACKSTVRGIAALIIRIRDISAVNDFAVRSCSIMQIRIIIPVFNVFFFLLRPSDFFSIPVENNMAYHKMGAIRLK